MSTHNICFCGDKKNINSFGFKKKHLIKSCGNAKMLSEGIKLFIWYPCY